MHKQQQNCGDATEKERLQLNDSPRLEDNRSPVPANGRGLQSVMVAQMLEHVRQDQGREFAPVRAHRIVHVTG